MNETSSPGFWKKCSSCKAPIAFSQKYWICSVSTCNRQRTGLAFCKVSCFDAHVPMMNHKDAGAIEKRAPTLAEWKQEQAPVSMRSVETPKSVAVSSEIPHEILVVVSKAKDYVKVKHGLNTSQDVMDVLSDRLRMLLDDASRRAAQEGRKTLMGRDFR